MTFSEIFKVLTTRRERVFIFSNTKTKCELLGGKGGATGIKLSRIWTRPPSVAQELMDKAVSYAQEHDLSPPQLLKIIKTKYFCVFNNQYCRCVFISEPSFFTCLSNSALCAARRNLELFRLLTVEKSIYFRVFSKSIYLSGRVTRKYVQFNSF